MLQIPNPESRKDQSLRIEKNDAVMEKIYSMAAKGLSATALNSFRECQMQFYFKKIAGISEPEDIAEEIDARIFGNILHEVLENLYSETIGELLTDKKIQQFRTRVSGLIHQSFQEHFPQGDSGTGKTHLSLKVANALINRFLTMEAERIKTVRDQNQHFTVHGLEQDFVTSITTEKGNTAQLYGKIDRIDKAGNEIHLFDYKTGFIGDTEINLKNWDDLFSGDEYGKVFQLLFYALLYKSQPPDNETVKTGIISFRKLTQGIQYLQLPDGISNHEAVVSFFKPYLDTLIDSLLDPSEVIVQTDNTELCTRCPYASICYRES